MDEMYKGIPFSPPVALADSIGPADTVIKVTDITAFPDGPNYATIGTDEEGETVFYAAKTSDSLSGCIRGIEGTAKSWTLGSTIARNCTNKDFEAIQKNIRELASSLNDVKKDIPTSADDLDALPIAGGTMKGPIDMNGKAITGLNDPVEETDALRLGYLKSKYLSIDQMYPVGAVYISTTSKSPASLFGGSWEQIKGKFLLGADTTHANGSTGGAETVALTTENLPSHQHGLGGGWSFNWKVGGSGTYIAAEIVGGSWEGNKPYASSGTSDTIGGNTAHNNMPPYLAVYIWKRVS